MAYLASKTATNNAKAKTMSVKNSKLPTKSVFVRFLSLRVTSVPLRGTIDADDTDGTKRRQYGRYIWRMNIIGNGEHRGHGKEGAQKMVKRSRK